MLVVTVIIYMAFSTSIVSGQKLSFNSRRSRGHKKSSKVVQVTTIPTPTTETISTEIVTSERSTDNTISTDVFEETTTIKTKERICRPEQSEFKKEDLSSIIHLFLKMNKVVDAINAGYYVRAVQVRNKFAESFDIFEKKIENRPQHLKHILEDVVSTRQRIEPVVKQTATLLSQFESYENSFTVTKHQAIKFIEHLNNSKLICQFNCGNYELENLIMETSAGDPLQATEVYCDTFDNLTEAITQKLMKFQNEYSQELNNKIDEDSEILEIKIKDIKNKLKVAAVNQFGPTMYDILNLQDEYFHFSADIINYNISSTLQDIKQKLFEINSKLVELETLTKEYRDYCNSCSNRLVYTVSNFMNEFNRNAKESTFLLDETIQEIIEQIQISIEAQYNAIFEELNQKLDENTIIEANLLKLTPIQSEVASEIKNETEIFEHLQSLVPKSSIIKTYALADKSHALLHTIDDGLVFIREHMR